MTVAPSFLQKRAQMPLIAVERSSRRTGSGKRELSPIATYFEEWAVSARTELGLPSGVDAVGRDGERIAVRPEHGLPCPSNWSQVGTIVSSFCIAARRQSMSLIRPSHSCRKGLKRP